MPEFIEVPFVKKQNLKRKLVFGVAVNDADYQVSSKNKKGKTIKCPYYVSWISMLNRCYGVKYKENKPTYSGCYVTNKWLRFTVFKSWMKLQNWQGMALDKDIKIIGNKVYGPDTCLFVTKEINALLTDHAAARGAYPQGVSFYKPLSKFRAQCSVHGTVKHIGYFISPEKASASYKLFKNAHILNLANQPENSYIKEYLLNHARLLE